MTTLSYTSHDLAPGPFGPQKTIFWLKGAILGTYNPQVRGNLKIRISYINLCIEFFFLNLKKLFFFAISMFFGVI